MNATEARELTSSTVSTATQAELNSFYSEIQKAAKKGYSYISVSGAPSVQARKVLENQGYKIIYKNDEGQGRSWHQITW